MEESKMTQEGAVKESLTTELDTIKAVFLNDMKLDETDVENTHVNIKVDGDCVQKDLFACTFSINLLPSTADSKMEQFVALTLRFQIPVKYPEEVPKIELKGPRGLSDEKVDKIEADLKKLAEEKKGSNMLYELIDFVKESLTAYNFPSGKCMICLYEFTKEDVFVKTDCFHHFHSYCLAGYMKSVTEKSNEIAETTSDDLPKMPCPVCRLDCDLCSLIPASQECYPFPALSKAPIAQEKEILKEAREQQEKYSELFEKQQSQGGIIDEEEEKKRFLIHISNNPQSSESDTGKSQTAEASVAADTLNGIAQTSVPAKEPAASSPVASSSTEGVLTKSSEVCNETSLSQNSLADNDKLTPKCIHVTPKSIDQNQSNNSQSIDLSLLSSKLETLKTDDVDKQTPDHTSHIEADIENPSKENKASAAQEKSSTEVIGKDKTEKADSSTAPKQPRGGRRRRQRSRTKSGQAAVKSDTEQGVIDGNQQRNSSRPGREAFNGQYGQYRPRNRGRRRGRGRGRGRGNFANGGMASPPYRHNLNDGYGTESSEGRHRRSSYNADYDRQLNGSRDRPGYYAARVFKPAQSTSRSHQTHNKSEDTVASGSQSNQTDVTSSEPAGTGIAPRDGDGNRRGDRRRRYSRNRTRSGRFSEGDYYSDNGAAQYGYHNGNRMQSAPKNRQSAYAYYYRPPNYQRSYYDQMNGGYYPPYNYYSYNRPSYGYSNYSGYNSYGYGYGGYGRGRGSYGGGRRSNYRQRNRSDTHQSQSSARNEGNSSQKQPAAVNPVTSSPGNPTEVSP